MKPTCSATLLFAFLLFASTATLSWSTRPDPSASRYRQTLGGHHHLRGNNRNYPDGSGGPGFGIPGFGGAGSGGGFGVPGFGSGFPGSGFGGGYGYGYGGPTGGHSKGGIVRPTVVCKERGPCYLKKLTCPAKCFTSFHRSGKGYGEGGGGGGCTVDCEKRCTAYC